LYAGREIRLLPVDLVIIEISIRISDEYIFELVLEAATFGYFSEMNVQILFAAFSSKLSQIFLI
jgi:hypothetical protein